jgi:hypothetical protein
MAVAAKVRDFRCDMCGLRFDVNCSILFTELPLAVR